MRAALLVVLLAAEAGAQALTGATTLRRPLHARGIGMGDAFTAVEGGLSSIGYNPAAAARLTQPELKSSYTHGIIDDKFTLLTYAHPLASVVVTAGLAYYDAGTIHLERSDGTRESLKAQQDFVGLFGLSAPLTESLSVGGQVKAMRLELAGSRASAGAADAGLLWRTPLPGLALGAAALNMGPDVEFESEGDPLPLTLRGGAAYTLHGPAESTFAFSRFTLSADAVKVRDEELKPSAGMEMAMSVTEFGTALVRSGYIFDEAAGGFTAGIGLNEGRFSLDYGIGVNNGGVSHVHHVTFGISF